MATPIELVLLLAVLVLLFGAYRVTRAVKPFLVNAVVGLIVLLVASWLGFGVEITPIVVLVVAIGGLPGALLVLLLAHVGVAFTPALVAPFA